jgi:S-adenosylmethionine:tRNA ribosyltransferase-isomerase
MTTLAFELAPAREAGEPPDVRLMVASRADGEIVHARFRELPDFLRPGDLLVVNTSGTVPAAVGAVDGTGAAIEVRFSTRAPEGEAADLHVVELRTAGGLAPLRAGHAGESISLVGGGRLELVARYPGGERDHQTAQSTGPGRLWLARADLGVEGPAGYLARHGRPIRYGYVRERWPLSAYQTAYATVSGSAEMPSAGRPFTPELVTRLVARGVLVAPLVLHTGVSSPERHEPPYPEEYEVPAPTARLVNSVRAWGGRVIAVGTTVVRALETVAVVDGTVAPGSGWTNLVVSADRELRAVDGLITGWHEPQASHLQMLEALAGDEFVARCYAGALEHGYLWHEFGDSHLILP